MTNHSPSGSRPEILARHGRLPRVACTALLLSVACASSAATFLTGTGGVTSKFKGIATGTDLICDLSNVPIDAIAGPTPSLIIGGVGGATVTCSEVLTGTTTPVKTGAFTFAQTALDNCLSVATIAGKTTWTCQVPAVPVPSLLPVARWRVTPKPEEVTNFCTDLITQAIFSPCYAELGTPDSALNTDFPDRDVNGDALLDFGGATGVVFTFRSPDGTLKFGPCHSGTFDGRQPVLCSQTVSGTLFETQSKGAADADLIVAVNIEPDSLNLKNNSDTAAFPVVFYGAADLDVTQITRTDNLGNSKIAVVGPSGLAQSIRIKNSSYGYVAGSNGVVDAYRDLKVQFYRGDINKSGTFIYALTHPNGVARTECPKTQKLLKVNFRGILNGDASSVWIGDDKLVIFNCPAP